MQHKLLTFVALSLVLLATAPSRGAVVPFTGSLTLTFGGYPVIPVSVGGTGLATINGIGPAGHIDTLQIPASVFAANGLTVGPLTDPAAAPVSGLQLTVHNSAGTFADHPSGFGGPMPLLGVMKVCLFGSCPNAPRGNLVVPLSAAGAGGIVATTSSLVNVTAVGAPWTTGTAAIGAFAIAGFRHGPKSQFSSTAEASGSTRLVTPVLLQTNIPSGAIYPVFAILDLHFVPEPSTLTLLGTGIGGLALFGRTKRN